MATDRRAELAAEAVAAAVDFCRVIRRRLNLVDAGELAMTGADITEALNVCAELIDRGGAVLHEYAASAGDGGADRRGRPGENLHNGADDCIPALNGRGA